MQAILTTWIHSKYRQGLSSSLVSEKLTSMKIFSTYVSLPQVSIVQFDNLGSSSHKLSERYQIFPESIYAIPITVCWQLSFY